MLSVTVLDLSSLLRRGPWSVVGPPFPFLLSVKVVVFVGGTRDEVGGDSGPGGGAVESPVIPSTRGSVTILSPFLVPLLQTLSISPTDFS